MNSVLVFAYQLPFTAKTDFPAESPIGPPLFRETFESTRHAAATTSGGKGESTQRCAKLSIQHVRRVGKPCDSQKDKQGMIQENRRANEAKRVHLTEIDPQVPDSDRIASFSFAHNSDRRGERLWTRDKMLSRRLIRLSLNHIIFFEHRRGIHRDTSAVVDVVLMATGGATSLIRLDLPQSLSLIKPLLRTGTPPSCHPSRQPFHSIWRAPIHDLGIGSNLLPFMRNLSCIACSAGLLASFRFAA